MYKLGRCRFLKGGLSPPILLRAEGPNFVDENLYLENQIAEADQERVRDSSLNTLCPEAILDIANFFDLLARFDFADQQRN